MRWKHTARKKAQLLSDGAVSAILYSRISPGLGDFIFTAGLLTSRYLLRSSQRYLPHCCCVYTLYGPLCMRHTRDFEFLTGPPSAAALLRPSHSANPVFVCASLATLLHLRIYSVSTLCVQSSHSLQRCVCSHFCGERKLILMTVHVCLPHTPLTLCVLCIACIL